MNETRFVWAVDMNEDEMKCFHGRMKQNETDLQCLVATTWNEIVAIMNENAFHSFMVAEQVFLWQLP